MWLFLNHIKYEFLYTKNPINVAFFLNNIKYVCLYTKNPINVAFFKIILTLSHREKLLGTCAQ